jgi:hypothetical protein
MNVSDFSISLIAEVIHHIDKAARNTAVKRGDNHVFRLREKTSISVLKESVVRKNNNLERPCSILTEK